MISRHPLRFCLLLIIPLLQLSSAATCQTRKSVHEGAASGAVPPTNALQSLQQSRDISLRTNDPAQIAAAARTYLSELLIQMAKVLTISARTKEAADCYNAALAFDGSVAHRQEAGLFLLQTEKPADAVALLKPLTEGEQADAASWVDLALAYRAEAKYEEASLSFSKALEFGFNPGVSYAFGSVLLLQGEKARAAKLFQKIIAARGESAVWHTAFGDAYRNAGDYTEALAEFQSAIAIDPKAPHAEFFLGLTYLLLNGWGPNADSALHLRKAVALAPHEYLANFYLGAMESTQGSDFPASDRHLLAAAAADPSQPEVWMYLGLNANREHKDSLAEADLRKAIELTGSDEALNNYQIRRAYFALGRMLIASGKNEQGKILLDKFRKAQAASLSASSSTIASMGVVEGLGPSSVESPAVVQGVALPVHAAQKALALTPKQRDDLLAQELVLRHLLTDAYNDLGTAEARQQNYSDALVQFQEAEHWDPKNVQALRNLGTAAFRGGNFAEASRALAAYMEIATAGEKLTPAVQRAGLMLGFSDFNLGKFDEAAKAFGEAQPATMAESRAAYSWAFSLAHVGRAQEANSIADELMQRSLPPEQLGLVCHLYVDNENYEGSLACYRKALAADPTLQLAHYEAGQALVHLDRPAEAIAELEQEEKGSPGNPNVQSALAYALLQASRKEEAQALLVKVTTEHPEQADAQYQLGKLLLEQGKVADAVTHLEASERANALPDYVHYQLGVAYKKAGRQAEADRELKQYREIKDKKREASTAALPQAH